MICRNVVVWNTLINFPAEKFTLSELNYGLRMIERHLDAVNNNELFVSVEFNKVAGS